MKLNLVSLVCALSSGALAANHSSPVIDLGYVKYRGTYNESTGINKFQGIHYAQAPVGDLRFRSPLPIELGNDYAGKTLDATKAGKICGQCEAPPNDPAQAEENWSEDCLLLDVLVPDSKWNSRSDEGELLPVLVQIHGGGFVTGSTESSAGDGLVYKSEGGLIFVAIQYRLGMFGFLPGNEVAKDGDLNVGLRDQRAALEWVQRHISKFGGDPEKVTIWGGSAGGASVTHQMTAYGGGKDLDGNDNNHPAPFRAAIPEYPGWHSTFNETTQEAQFSNVLKTAGCDDLKCLRDLPEEKLFKVNQQALLNAYPSPGFNFGLFYYGPVIDGDFNLDLMTESFKQGRYYKVPTLTAHTTYEGYIFTNESLSTQEEATADAQHLFQFGPVPALLSRMYQLYPAKNFNSTFFQRQTWYGDVIYSCPTYFIADSIANHGANNSAIFKMLFAAGSQTHTASAPFLNSPYSNFPEANNQTIVDIMTSYWLSFAITQDPNPLRDEKAPFWQSYTGNAAGDEANGESVGFNTLRITYASVENHPDADASPQCDFWGSNTRAILQ